MISDLKIACLSTSSWQGLWTRKQWIMAQLAQRNDILYVNPQESATYRLRWSRRRKNIKSMSPPPDRFQIVQPWSVLPLGRHWRLFHSINMMLLNHQIRKNTPRMFPDIWWVYDPIMVTVAQRNPGRLLVYDCVDRHAAYGGFRGLVDTMEKRLLQSADIVFVTARGLETYCEQYSDVVNYLPNGFDAELYCGSSEIHTDLSAISRPIIGFIGGLGHWIDIDLISHIARRRPNWSLVFVGPLGDKAGSFPQMPNIHLLGRFPREDMPAFIQGFDVGIVPFQETLLTKTVNPLKAYEYLACGIPVVSTIMPELDHLIQVRQVRGYDAFVSATEDALDEGLDSSARAARMASVAAFSQQTILKRMEDLIEDIL